MRQRGSRRVRPRPNSRGNENITSPISCTEPSSPFDQSNDVSSVCSSVNERLPEISSDASNHEISAVNDHRTRLERYSSMNPFRILSLFPFVDKSVNFFKVKQFNRFFVAQFVRNVTRYPRES